ncbi:MAG: DUF1064 domain-containing protein [Bacteroidetes bacterium]|nr:DUF1064 domain-containing protein [Bacteroidota bacterium]
MIKHKFKKRPKYNAKRTEVDGIKFDSKKEATYFVTLKSLEKNGDIIFFLRQVPFHLPGGVKYVCDFQEFWADGTVKFVDVKGFKTAMYKAKKKMVESIYPIQITEI